MYRFTVLLLAVLVLISPAFAQLSELDVSYGGVNRLTPQQIAKKALDSTVVLLMKDANDQLVSVGSGFFLQPNVVATNNHVIAKAVSGVVKRVGNNTEFDIEGVVAIDVKHDLALLSVPANSDVPLLPLGDVDSVAIGDTVYVAGNPEGFEGTFSEGVISGIRGTDYDKRFQITAPISSGSSGGPVLNTRAEVIAVCVSVVSAGQNINFAVPSNYLYPLILESLVGSVKPLLVEDKESQSAVSYYNDGEDKRKLGDYVGAIADYDAAIRLNPNEADFYWSRGKANNGLKDYFAAIRDFDTAIRLNPDDFYAYSSRGGAKSSLGQYDAAIADFDTAIRLNPNYDFAYSHRGCAKADLEQYFAAIRDFDTAIRLNPNDDFAYGSRGYAKGKLGHYSEAIADYDVAIRLKPDDSYTYSSRGIAKHDLKQYSAAIVDYNMAIRLDPRAGDYVLRGDAKVKLGRYSAAISDYDVAIRLNPDDVYAYTCRGYAKEELGRYSAALADYDAAIRLNPNYDYARSCRRIVQGN